MIDYTYFYFISYAYTLIDEKCNSGHIGGLGVGNIGNFPRGQKIKEPDDISDVQNKLKRLLEKQSVYCKNVIILNYILVKVEKHKTTEDKNIKTMEMPDLKIDKDKEKK